MNFRGRKHKTISELVRGEKILDIGFAEHPNIFLKNPIGVDVQKIEKPDNYKKIYQVNLNKHPFPFRDKSFDTVCAGEVMEHVENASFVLREINRILKNQGIFIVSIPNATYYWNIFRDYFSSSIESMDKGEHLNCWTILDFKRLLKKNGFVVEKMYGTSLVLPPPLRWRIPVKHFPKLSWIIIYKCRKINPPIEEIITRTPPKKIYGKLDEPIFIKNN